MQAVPLDSAQMSAAVTPQSMRALLNHIEASPVAASGAVEVAKAAKDAALEAWMRSQTTIVQPQQRLMAALLRPKKKTHTQGVIPSANQT